MADASARVDAWTAEVIGHVQDDSSKERVRHFLSTEAAQRIVADWVIAEEKPPLVFTDMSDVYKPSMMGAFAHVQRRLDTDFGADAFTVRFTLHVRHSSELSLQDIFKRASSDSGGEWARIRDTWLSRAFSLTSRPFDVELLRDLPKALSPPLKGVVRIAEETLRELEGQPHTKAISLRLRLKPTGKPVDQWLEVAPDGDSGSYAARAAGDGPAEPLDDAVRKLSADGGFDLIFDAEGPWHLVTFCETSLMQETSAALGQGMQLLRGWTDTKFYAMALGLLDQRMVFLDDFLREGHPFDVFLFSGRRSTHAGFHLLQNLWCTNRLRNYKGTSSLFAYRIFRGYDWIGADGSPTHSDLKVMPLVGTHAHEASMVFQALAAEADDELEFPISSLLWHLNYWLLTGNQAVLPDTMGSPAFAHLLDQLQFPPRFVESFNARHAAPKQLKGGVSIAEELLNPAIGGLIRQDSGDIQGFIEHYFSPAIQLRFPDGKPTWVDVSTGAPSTGFKCLASEISSDDDVREARRLGFLGMGTGGYLGEKPWASAGDTGVDGDKLNSRIDLVAKISCVRRPESGEKFYPVKLGDFAETGCWHHTRPGKFAISPEVDDAGDDGSSMEVFKRFQRQGEVLTGNFFNLGNYQAEEKKPKRFDEWPEWRQQRLNELWEQFNFMDPA